MQALHSCVHNCTTVHCCVVMLGRNAGSYRCTMPCMHACMHAFIHSFILSFNAFQSADEVRCSRHSMAALQPALSWDSSTM